ncbi:cysteine hydrolase family protein, partial [Planctomycetota bacterium]
PGARDPDLLPDHDPMSATDRPKAGRDGAFEALVSLLERIAGAEVATDFANVLPQSEAQKVRLSTSDATLLLIDPQRSFTTGAWMQSVGADAEVEVEPIRLAFDNCARLLRGHRHLVEVMFTRCPFPPDSYEWDERVTDLIDSSQPYFMKPGNSVLFPPTNGFREWLASLLGRGRKTLVMGGCTLNSCVRVSSIETQRYLRDRGMQVVVDLSLSGARTSNFRRSPLYAGRSSVESAIREMASAGVRVVACVDWAVTQS